MITSNQQLTFPECSMLFLYLPYWYDEYPWEIFPLRFLSIIQEGV